MNQSFIKIHYIYILIITCNKLITIFNYTGSISIFESIHYIFKVLKVQILYALSVHLYSLIRIDSLSACRSSSSILVLLEYHFLIAALVNLLSSKAKIYSHLILGYASKLLIIDRLMLNMIDLRVSN